MIKNLFFAVAIICASAKLFADAPQEYLLCNNSIADEKDAKNCISEVFFKKHTQTYYGSTIYFAADQATKERVLIEVGRHIDVYRDEQLNPNYKTIIENSEYVAMAKDEQDLTQFHIYALDKDKNHDQKLATILTIYADSFEKGPALFGFAPSQALYSYKYR